MTAGPDGNIWFNEEGGKIGKITPAGVVIEFPVPTTTETPSSITAGADGNLWFTVDTQYYDNKQLRGDWKIAIGETKRASCKSGSFR